MVQSVQNCSLINLTYVLAMVPRGSLAVYCTPPYDHHSDSLHPLLHFCSCHLIGVKRAFIRGKMVTLAVEPLMFSFAGSGLEQSCLNAIRKPSRLQWRMSIPVQSVLFSAADENSTFGQLLSELLYDNNQSKQFPKIHLTDQSPQCNVSP